MKFGPRSASLSAASAILMCLLGLAPASAQTDSAQKPLLAEEAFKNVQVLRGIPIGEFMETMGFFAVSLSANCTTCHGEASAGSWDLYAVDTPLKQTTRRMVLMMNAINQANFGGKREVTCFTCHRGDREPRITPGIADVYNSVIVPVEPDKLLPAATSEHSVDQILDRYLQALGGAQQLAKLTSIVGQGTSQAYSESEYPVQIFAKAPNQFSSVSHTDAGDRTATYDGRTGWTSVPSDDKPIPLLPLIQDDLAGAKIDTAVWFPTTIRQVLTQLRVGNPNTINDKSVLTIQGTIDGGRTPVNLYFDEQSGLLTRLVRYSDTKIGLAATQIDYEDYRDVAGMKIPFHWTVSWLDGQTVYQLTQVQANVPVDSAKFAKPAPSKPPSTPPAGTR